MAKKQFKTESKKLLDMMINSIYTHKEIFLRELISNASDAIDKLYFKSLTDSSIKLKRKDYEIRIEIDREERILKIIDNGIGMNKDELETNLGTIAKSGSFDFKGDKEKADEKKIDIIGQFGVGFYSAFMVSDNVTVESLAFGENEAYKWQASGVDGYTIEPTEKDKAGTTITLHIKDDVDEDKYSEFLDEYRIKQLIKKYSDYIRYPIKMLVTKSKLKDGCDEKNPEYESYKEEEILNSMTPIWKKTPSKVKKEEYDNFYQDKFMDYEAPLKVIHQRAEGTSTYEALLFVPAHAPFDYYSRDYEKGLQLYSSSVLIMDKCKDLVPEYFSFVKGLVDSSDLSLNVSREMLQHDHQLKIIAKALEKKISSTLAKMMETERENYEKFFESFGPQLKYGVYSDYGMHKDVLKDLIMFKSSFENKLVSLKEYISRIKDEQTKIFYATGTTTEQISLLPQVESVVSRGFEVLYLTDDVDEFALQIMREYEGKEFANVCKDDIDIESAEEKGKINTENDNNSDLLNFIKESIGDDISKVKFTGTLKNHPVCISSEGNLSVGMEKTLNKMPGSDNQKVKAELVLEINIDHSITEVIKNLYNKNNDKLAKYSKLLYEQARLISGMEVSNPTKTAEMICELMCE